MGDSFSPRKRMYEWGSLVSVSPAKCEGAEAFVAAETDTGRHIRDIDAYKVNAPANILFMQYIALSLFLRFCFIACPPFFLQIGVCRM
jgi:hypothetical protein